jgi:hypothetical protein
MNIRKIDDSPHQIASTTRRHLLTATASSLITSAATASTVLGATSLQARRLVSWNTNEGIWRCWFEGHASDVPLAADDAQELFGSRVKIQHVIAQDIEWLLGNPHGVNVPTLRVGCATSDSVAEAVETAFHRAGVNPVRRDDVATTYGGLILISANQQALMLESYRAALKWLDQRFGESICFGQQFLVDDSLSHGMRRVSVVIAT